MDLALVQKIEKFLSDEESLVETLDLVFRIPHFGSTLTFYVCKR